MNETERAFHRAMVMIYETAKRELGYNATRFLQTIEGLADSATVQGSAGGRLLRVAALGSAGIPDEKMRRIFETPDPPRMEMPKLGQDFPVDPFYANNAPAPWETPMY